jgi:hypothetical protein
MVKVCEMLGTDDPLGLLGSSIHPEDAQNMANTMRALLNSDIWEDEKERAVFVLNSELSLEMQSAVWRFLNSKERRAWKAYLDQWRERGSHAYSF